MLYKFRVILDSKDDVFRDIEIKGNMTLGKLHEGIKSAFSLQGDEMASFYYSDQDWNQGEELPLEDMTDDGSGETMYDVFINEELNSKGDRLLYVYDFMNMWTFYVEVQDIEDKKPTANYPRTTFRYGKMPLKVPTKTNNNPDDIFNLKEEDMEEYTGDGDEDIIDGSMMEDIDDLDI